MGQLAIASCNIVGFWLLQSLSAGYKFTGKDLRIFHGDVLKFNMAPLFPFEEKKKWTDSPPNLHVIGNLPFNISSPLIILWLRQISERTGAWRYGMIASHKFTCNSEYCPFVSVTPGSIRSEYL